MKRTVSEWIEEYMYDCKCRQLRPKTMQSYEQTLRLFERWLREEQGIEDVKQVTEPVMRRYIVDLQERGKYTAYAIEAVKISNYPERRRDYREKVSNITINNYIRNIRAFFNWLELEEALSKNPMKKIRQLKAEREAREFLEDEEFIGLTRRFDLSYFVEHRDYVVIHLLFDTGMRLGECLQISVNDMDLKQRNIYLQGEVTKGRKSRTVFFSKKTEKILRRWLQFKDRYCESDRLFPVQATGEAVNVAAFEKNFRKYLLRAGITKKLSPHALRNNFAKRCLLSGMDIYTLSRILGHSSVTVTEKAYLDITDDDLSRRYRSFSPLENMKGGNS